MTGSEDDRPDAAGIRPLRAAVGPDGTVYVDLASFAAGYRSRADALEQRGYRDIAALYRREADELDTAAIGALSDDKLPRMGLPAKITGNVSMMTAQLVGEALRDHEDTRLPMTVDGRSLIVDIRVDRGFGPW